MEGEAAAAPFYVLGIGAAVGVLMWLEAREKGDESRFEREGSAAIAWIMGTGAIYFGLAIVQGIQGGFLVGTLWSAGLVLSLALIALPSWVERFFSKPFRRGSLGWSLRWAAPPLGFVGAFLLANERYSVLDWLRQIGFGASVRLALIMFVPPLSGLALTPLVRGVVNRFWPD